MEERILALAILRSIGYNDIKLGGLLKWSKRRDSKSRRPVTPVLGFKSLTLRHEKRRCLKIVKETIERQRLFHLAKIVEKGDLFKP